MANTRFNPQNHDEDQVLIVPARTAYPDYERYGLYFCQANRSYRAPVQLPHLILIDLTSATGRTVAYARNHQYVPMAVICQAPKTTSKLIALTEAGT